MSDQFDDDLAAALQSRAGNGAASTAVAHDAVLARASHVRRRRAAIAGGGATLVLLIGGIALLPRGGSDSLAPSDTGDVVPSIDEPVPSTTEAGDTTSQSGMTTTSLLGPDQIPSTSGGVVGGSPGGSTTSTATSETSASTAPGTASTLGDQPTTTGGTGTTIDHRLPTTTSPTSSTDPAGSSTSTTTAGSQTTAGAPTTTAPGEQLPDPFTETYNSSGGSITVDWDGSSLSLLAVDPQPGFESDVKDNTSTRIRVEFDDGNTDSRIEVRLNGTEIDVTIS